MVFWWSYSLTVILDDFGGFTLFFGVFGSIVYRGLLLWSSAMGQKENNRVSFCVFIFRINSGYLRPCLFCTPPPKIADCRCFDGTYQPSACWELFFDSFRHQSFRV